MPKFKNIPQLPRAYYSVDVPAYAAGYGLLEHLARYVEQYQLDLNPDFQRGHVWSTAQQIAYNEWILQGGESGKNLYFNAPNFNRGEGPMQLTDGKQRIEAIRAFIENEIPAFGYYRHQFSDEPRLMDAGVKVSITVLPTRAAVLKFYLQFNGGGIAHSEEELTRVRQLLAAELAQES